MITGAGLIVPIQLGDGARGEERAKSIEHL
jgi:hypothetical protein